MLTIIMRIFYGFEEATEVNPKAIRKVRRAVFEALEKVFEKDLDLRGFLLDITKNEKLTLREIAESARFHLGAKIDTEEIPGDEKIDVNHAMNLALAEEMNR